MSLLERRLGVQLLVRTRQGSVLTEAGELLVVSARAVVEEIDGLLDAAAALRRQRRPTSRSPRASPSPSTYCPAGSVLCKRRRVS